MAYGQAARSCGSGGASAAAASLPPGAGSFQVIPSICVSERYDSNVFFAPKTPGLKRDDFVTNVSPTVRVDHAGEYASGNLEMGGFGETYVNNPSLNYIGTADTLNLNLDKTIKRFFPNASLSITDYVRYTPTPPGFSNPAAGTSPGAPSNIQNIYAQGLVAYRTNNLINTGTVTASYATSPTTSLNASYSHAILRFGSSPVSNTSQITLFDTTTQTGSVGGTARVSALDSLSVQYSHSESQFTPHTSSGLSGFFKVDTATLKWSRTLTPYLNAEVGGGGILITPGLTTYAANAALVMNLPTHVATVSYARTASPGYVGAGVPVTTDIFSLTAIQNISQQWRLVESANYSHSSGGSGSTAVKFDTYSTSVGLDYFLTRIWSTGLSFDYMNIEQEFGGTKTAFDRYAATISVKAVWE